MSAIPVPMLPETAPFTPGQRAWLNGFFAGLFTARSNGTQIAAAPAAPPLAPAPAQAEEDFPWHDASISMEERLKLAHGRPHERILMAAMAQLDCGACGYLCQTYSEAIARGEEKDLSKCAPGGNETARKLKELVARGPAIVSVKGMPLAARAAAPGETPAKSRYHRLHPFPAPLLTAEPLNSAGSAKDTRLVVLGLAGSGLTYKVGDSLGVYPDN